MFTPTNQAKQKFVEQKRLERERREKDRLEKEELEKKDNAARILQRWWRLRMQARRAEEQCWQWWDAQFNDNMTIFDFYQIVGVYCMITRRKQQQRGFVTDKARLKKLSKSFTTNKFKSNSNTNIPYYTLLIDMRYMSLARKYLELIINQCIMQCIASNENITKSSLELTLLLQYLNPKTYQTKHTVDPVHVIDIPDRILQSLGQSILKSTLCQCSNLKDAFVSCVTQIIKLENRGSRMTAEDKQRVNAMKLWLSTMARLTLYPVEHAELSSDSLDLKTAFLFLWSNTLSVPYLVSLINAMTADRLRKWTLGAVTPFLMENRSLWTNTLGGNECLFLMGNLIDLWNNNENARKNEQETGLMDWVQYFLKTIQPFFSDRQIPNHPRYHPLFKWSNATWGNSIDSFVFDKVIKQIEYVWSRSFMDHVFQKVVTMNEPKQEKALNNISMSLNSLQVKRKQTVDTNGDSNSNGGGEISLLAIEIESIFSMYMQLTLLFKSHRKVIFYRIAFTHQLMPKLWTLMNKFGPKGNMLIYLNAAKKPDIDQEPLVQVLRVFCEACSVVFLTLDDVDIFKHKAPFSPDDLIHISKFLNQFYFSIIQQQTPIPSELPPAADSFKAARRLLLQIYDLDLHHPFCPPNHWLLISMTSGVKSFFSSLFQNMNQEEKRNNGNSKKLSSSTASLFLNSVRQGDPVPLRVLQLMPHTIPFNIRLQIFRDWIALDRTTVMNTGNKIIRVRRDRVLEDGYHGLCGLSPSSWKGNIRVSFVNELGVDEAGIDQGGPFKDFITMLISEAFEPNHGLFAATKTNSYYPNPTSSVHGANHIQLFEFIGKTIGKALYEGVLLDVQFAGFLLARLLGRNIFLEELKELDEEVWRNLTFIKHYEGDVEDLGLTFEADEDVFGKIQSHDLKYSGKNISVTSDNKVEYIYLMADYKLNQRTKEQTKAFIHGFRTVISESWIKLFSPPELQRALSGEDTDFDVSDLRKHTVYQDGYFDQHPVIRSLWQIVDDFSSSDKRAFLKFATGCPKPPLGGFDYLQPPFTIRMVSTDASGTLDGVGVVKSFFKMNMNKSGRLPSSSTCFNLLKLPAYTKKSLLKDKLCYAIHSNTGFELS
ncbi:HECT-domain-containing protein [Backusella circina FSU 941]|nr:HECT-domain-containing protein [Backusella circina FSU 941]